MKNTKFLRLGVLLSMVLTIALMLSSQWASVFVSGFGMIISCMFLLWLLSLAIKDASIVDIFWGMGFVLSAWYYALFALQSEMGIHQKILLALVTLWGLRLAIYLGIRNIGKAEDYRYANWRNEYGDKWWWVSFLRVFVLQGMVMWLIGAVLVPGLANDAALSVFDYVGIIFWLIGIFFEAVGDWQLMQFKNNRDNKGKVMDKGVWRYTRHPNYFGDAMVWWGFFFFAVSASQGICFILCPILMTTFLLKISGVAMLEKSLKKNKPGYDEYIRKTSAFVPMLPKK